MYMVVKKPSPQAAIAPSDVVESDTSYSPEQPTEVTGYQIERVNDTATAEKSPEVSTPPRTEEMGILVENSDSGSFDDAVYEIVD